MSDPASSTRSEWTDKSGSEHSLERAIQTSSTVKDLWQNGTTPNLRDVLAVHPELEHHRTIVLKLACEEYRLRLKAGDRLDPEEFSRQYPSLERSLYFLIALDGLATNDPSLAAFQDTASWPEPGSCFLGFDLISELGRGAMGRVFLAAERALGQRRVVLKVAMEGGREADFLGRLRHANIVPVYSIQEDFVTRLTGACMPYLGQATLAAVRDGLHADGHLPIKAAAILAAVQSANTGAEVPEAPPADRILRKGIFVEGIIHLGVQLAEGLAHAHTQGIFHRDLKPSNILMSPDGRPLLLDFHLSVEERQTVRHVGGTLLYMPPEELARLGDAACERNAPHYDPRSDLFSLGVILYELLSGELPFGKLPRKGSVEEIAAALRLRQAEGPPPLTLRNRQVDKRLAGLIGRCLAFNPEGRPETAKALAADLGKELTWMRRLRRRAAAHRRWVLAAALAATLLVLGTAAFFAYRPPRNVRLFQQAQACFEAGQDDSALECLNESLAIQPRWGEALIARARVQQRRGNFNSAFSDYETAMEVQPSPRINACMGYCLSQLRQHEQAAVFYGMAIDSGDDSPAVLNNMGYTCLRLARLADAERYLRRAIQADVNLQAARHNLAVVFLQRAAAGATVLARDLDLVHRALEIGPQSGELCRNLAYLYALAAKQDAALLQPAIDCVARAVALGIDPQPLKTDPAFAALASNPAFQEALVVPATLLEPVAAVRLIDPAETGSLRP